MIKIQLVLISILATVSLPARPASDSSSVAVGGSFAFGYFPSDQYWPTLSHGPVSFKPGVSVGLSSTFLFIPIIDPAGIELTLQAVYSRSSTGQLDILEVSAQQAVVMLWPRLTTTNELAPYVEVGLGYGYGTFKEQYTRAYWDSPSEYATGFSIGFGGGMSLRLSNQIVCEGYVQTIYILKSFRLVGNGELARFSFHVFDYAGLRLVYQL